MPPRKTNKTDELFNVNGLSIKQNAIYVIENRYDASAPSGFQKERSTKLPSADVGNTIDCPFVMTNAATKAGVYDTGFYEHSPCYKNEDKARVKERLKVLDQYVISPFESLKGEQGILNQKNEDFWKSYLIHLGAGRVFKTDDPDDMLQLYIAMMAGELCPENDQGNPKYKQADYVIVDKAKEKTVKQKTAVSKITAIGKFFALLNENPQKLIHVLRYIGIANITDKTDDTTFMTLFSTWLDNHQLNAEKFETLLEKLEDKTFEEAVYMHSTLKILLEKRKINKNSAGDYVYAGIPLGKDLQSVAKNLIVSSELSEVKAQILEEK